jgi:hypothetical protein
MPKVKQASKKKHVTKAVPVLGAAGLTFSLVGGASAAVAPITDVPQTPNMAPSHAITLGDEEIADVSLATFYVFDKENAGSLRGLVQEARGCGCRGCGGRGLQRMQGLRRLPRLWRLRRRRLLSILGWLPRLLMRAAFRTY